MPELLVIDKQKNDPYCFPKPDGWEFQDEEHADNGQYITVKVKADGDKLKITEVEGMPVKKEDDKIPYVPDFGKEAE